jgi:arginyl-tRNA synthetase
MISEDITQSIRQALSQVGLESDSIALEHPDMLLHGDYSTNVALSLAKKANKNPRALAEEIVSALVLPEGVASVTIAGPGFINFFLTPTYLIEQVSKIEAEGDEWGNGNVYSGKRILLEHSSPNLFKPFHIGHIVNNVVGESIGRILKASGAEVITVSFPSDISPGIAKAVWGLLQSGVSEPTIIDIGKAYVIGTKAYEESPEAKNAIDAINTEIYTSVPGAALEMYKKGRDISEEYFLRITHRLGSDFSRLIYESESEVAGKIIVKANTPKVFSESQGAVIFEGSKYGLFDNVFINSAGFGTYLCKDIGLLSIKFHEFNFDKSITVTDIEQKPHFELVRKAAELIDMNWFVKTEYIQHGRLQFAEGKVSSRLGNVPLAEDLLNDVIAAVESKVHERVDAVDVARVSEQIAFAAIKFPILKVSRGRNMLFDIDASISVEGDSGPYIQYTYARCMSLLSKNTNHAVVQNDSREVGTLEKIVYRFPEVVARAADEYEPHYIAQFLLQIASEFNTWYAETRILDSEDEAYKLQVVQAVAQTLKNGLKLLSIDTPGRM